MESRPDRIYFNTTKSGVQLKPTSITLKGDGSEYKSQFYWTIFWKRAFDVEFFTTSEWPVLLYYASWIWFCLHRRKLLGLVFVIIPSLVGWVLWVMYFVLVPEELFPSDHLFVSATFEKI